MLRRARAIVVGHGAQLTVGVMAGWSSRQGGCAVGGARWHAMMREDTAHEFTCVRAVLGQTAAHLTEIAGSGPRAIAAVADGLGCDLILVAATGSLRARFLARRVRRRTAATVAAVGPR